MRISEKALKILSTKLPAGSASKIQQSLADKGEPYSLSYIYKVLDPDYPDYNPAIIAEAVKLAEKKPIFDPKRLEDQILRLRKS